MQNDARPSEAPEVRKRVGAVPCASAPTKRQLHTTEAPRQRARISRHRESGHGLVQQDSTERVQWAGRPTAGPERDTAANAAQAHTQNRRKCADGGTWEPGKHPSTTGLIERVEKERVQLASHRPERAKKVQKGDHEGGSRTNESPAAQEHVEEDTEEEDWDGYACDRHARGNTQT